MKAAVLIIDGRNAGVSVPRMRIADVPTARARGSSKKWRYEVVRIATGALDQREAPLGMEIRALGWARWSGHKLAF